MIGCQKIPSSINYSYLQGGNSQRRKVNTSLSNRRFSRFLLLHVEEKSKIKWRGWRGEQLRPYDEALLKAQLEDVRKKIGCTLTAFYRTAPVRVGGMKKCQLSEHFFFGLFFWLFRLRASFSPKPEKRVQALYT